MIHPTKFFVLVMQYVYVLKSLKDDTLYTGCSSDLQQRIKLHNAGACGYDQQEVSL